MEFVYFPITVNFPNTHCYLELNLSTMSHLKINIPFKYKAMSIAIKFYFELILLVPEFSRVDMEGFDFNFILCIFSYECNIYVVEERCSANIVVQYLHFKVDFFYTIFGSKQRCKPRVFHSCCFERLEPYNCWRLLAMNFLLDAAGC